jgi:molybdate transport system regulatory protein
MQRLKKKKTQLRPRIKVWLETDGQYAFGFGLSEILRAVEQHGSIKQAAGSLGKSYRYIWGRLKEAEQALGLRLVETQVGGKGTQRSFLTPAAQRLVRDFMTIRGRIMKVADQEFQQRFGSPHRVPNA